MTKHRDTMRALFEAATSGKLNQRSKLMVTEKTRDEVLDETGVDVTTSDVFELVKPPAEDPKDGDEHILVCVPKDEDDELLLPDNATASCGWCGRTVQFRPNVPNWLTKVCIPCTLQRATSMDN